MNYINQQMTNVRSVLGRKEKEKEEELLHMCFDAIRSDLDERKKKEENEKKMREVEGKLQKFSSDQVANTKKVMTRMSAGNDATLVNMCFQEWVQFCAEYKKNLEME